MANQQPIANPFGGPVITDPEYIKKMIELADLQISDIRERQSAKKEREAREKAFRSQGARDAREEMEKRKREQEYCPHVNMKAKGGILNVVAVHRLPDGTCLVLCPYCKKTGIGTEAEMRKEFKNVWPEEDAIGFTWVGKLPLYMQATTDKQW